MKLNEITDLINEIFECSLMERKEIRDMFISFPNPRVYDAESKGYKLCLRKTLVNESSRDCIKSIVEKHKLKLKESQEYLIIYTPRKS